MEKIHPEVMKLISLLKVNENDFDEYGLYRGDLTNLYGQHYTTLYYYAALMEGDGDIIDDYGTTRFKITPEERKMMPSLKGKRYFYIEFDGSGNVYGS